MLTLPCFIMGVNDTLFYSVSILYKSNPYGVNKGLLKQMYTMTSDPNAEQGTTHSHYKAWKSQDIFYITQIVFG